MISKNRGGDLLCQDGHALSDTGRLQDPCAGFLFRCYSRPKKQQMRWTERGAHLLLQVRTQVLNEDLRTTFQRWYPGMEADTGQAEEVAA